MQFRPHRPGTATGVRGRRIPTGITTMAVVAALAMTVAPAGPAAAAPDAPPPAPSAASPATTTLPAAGTPRPPAGKASTPGGAMLAMRVADPELAARSLGGTPELAVQQEFVCSQTMGGFPAGVILDRVLEQSVDFFYDATVDCTFTLPRIVGGASVFDRSPAFLGQTFDGRTISTGSQIDATNVFFSSSLGSFRASAFTYHGARVVEPVFDLRLTGPPGLVWTVCNEQPGLRYLTCDGIGTGQLHIVIGTGDITTGLTRACRNFTAGLNREETRLYQPSTTNPTSTGLMQRVREVANELGAFRRDLCATSNAGALAFVQQRGQRLWDVATARARAGAASGDDRPLYWARLGMVVALRQWVPPTAISPADLDALVRQLEFTSRGMASVTFTGSGKRVFISGFDPFALEVSRFGASALSQSNVSGASVLRLDGQSVSGGQVQAVIFPVRYRDFDQGLVETVYQPMLNGGADLAMSISLGVDNDRGDFELEMFNGRNRSTDSTFPDNEEIDTPGTRLDPRPPLNIAAGPQWTTSTLPVDQIDGADFTAIDRHVVEIRATGQTPVPSETGPTAGSISVHGSGGGFLSNEIAYRVTRLRDALGSPVPAGHLHTPGSDGTDTGRATILLRCANIVGAASLAA